MTKGKFAKHIERGWREICVDFEDMTSRAVEKNRFKHAARRNINHTVGTLGGIGSACEGDTGYFGERRTAPEDF